VGLGVKGSLSQQRRLFGLSSAYYASIIAIFQFMEIITETIKVVLHFDEDDYRPFASRSTISTCSSVLVEKVDFMKLR
jgi:hypothetical protein